MKKIIFTAAMFLCISTGFAQQFKLITTIESVVPGGGGIGALAND
jgi:hypothetical protein